MSDPPRVATCLKEPAKASAGYLFGANPHPDGEGELGFRGMTYSYSHAASAAMFSYALSGRMTPHGLTSCGLVLGMIS